MINTTLNLNHRQDFNNHFVTFAIKIVCNYYDLPIDVFTNRTRYTKRVMARHIIIFLTLKYCNITLKDLQELCNFKNHSSIVHSRTTIRNLLSWDKVLKKEMTEIENTLIIETESTSGRLADENCYFVNLNNCKSISANDQSIVFVNCNPAQIKQLKSVLDMPPDTPVKEHINTGNYLFLKKEHEERTN